MSSVFGNKIRVSIFGQSHGEKIGCVVDGLPAGEEVDLEELRRFLSRRAPGQKGTTPRRETDQPHIVSGLLNGKTCGAPLCVLMDNADTHSGDYDELKDVPRPGHADYPAAVKYRGFQDARGGGHFSARLTARGPGRRSPPFRGGREGRSLRPPSDGRRHAGQTKGRLPRPFSYPGGKDA